MKKITILILALCFTVTSIGQILVTGVVSNDSIPLESASVLIKNSTKGIATNSKGEFKIEAKQGDTLSVSYLGYKVQEFVLNKTEKIDVKLEEDIFDEVVIIGYGTMTRTIFCCGGTSVCVTHLYDKSDHINKLFPNPSSNGLFQLKLIEDYDEVKISIANSSGQIIQNSTHQKFGEKVTIDVSQFASGIYIINIIADGKQLESIKAIRS